jgi:antitoxin HicB
MRDARRPRLSLAPAPVFGAPEVTAIAPGSPPTDLLALDWGRITSAERPMANVYKVPLVLTPQPEGGFTVTSPVLPELVSEGDTIEEALENVKDALKAVVETYEDLGRPLPPNLHQDAQHTPISFETLVDAA